MAVHSDEDDSCGERPDEGSDAVERARTALLPGTDADAAAAGLDGLGAATATGLVTAPLVTAPLMTAHS